jgi:peptidoglycan L-alanyl-D-glutamate endopeptidase CwlK
MDSISALRLKDLHPVLASRAVSLLTQLEMEGFECRITQGLRTFDEQNDLWKQGRNGNPGPVVTNAPAGYSWHNYGLAFDVVPIGAGGSDWNTSHSDWQRIISLAPMFKLFSGSLFRSFPDAPHLQPIEIPESPTDEDRQTFTDGGSISVWRQYFPDDTAT